MRASRVMNDAFALRANVKVKSGRNACVSSAFSFIMLFARQKATETLHFALCTLHFICRKANNSSGISPTANILRLAAYKRA
jgi:hypothetical protein